MESYGDFVYFGGGGGYEIKNQIVGYRMEPGNPILTKIIHEEHTGEGVSNFMTLPKDGGNVLIASVDQTVHFYNIEQKTGALSLLQKFEADFSAENPSLNNVVLSFDNTLLATGGDDMAIRIFGISKDFKSNE